MRNVAKLEQNFKHEGPKPSEGVVKRGLEGPQPSEGIVKEAWKAQNHRKVLKEAWKAQSLKRGLEDPKLSEGVVKDIGRPETLGRWSKEAWKLGGVCKERFRKPSPQRLSCRFCVTALEWLSVRNGLPFVMAPE